MNLEVSGCTILKGKKMSLRRCVIFRVKLECPELGFSVQERHGLTRESPVKGHKDD